MKGLELSQAFFEEHGRPMLETQFPELLPFLAAGLFGSGSECFGYDDVTSQDHDFEPGFCFWNAHMQSCPGVSWVINAVFFLRWEATATVY